MPENERANPDLWAFWSSLPAILTGTAAVVAAVGTLFIGGDGAEAPAPGAGLTVWRAFRVGCRPSCTPHRRECRTVMPGCLDDEGAIVRS